MKKNRFTVIAFVAGMLLGSSAPFAQANAPSAFTIEGKVGNISGEWVQIQRPNGKAIVVPTKSVVGDATAVRPGNWVKATVAFSELAEIAAKNPQLQVHKKAHGSVAR